MKLAKMKYLMIQNYGIMSHAADTCYSIYHEEMLQQVVLTK